MLTLWGYNTLQSQALLFTNFPLGVIKDTITSYSILGAIYANVFQTTRLLVGSANSNLVIIVEVIHCVTHEYSTACGVKGLQNNSKSTLHP